MKKDFFMGGNSRYAAALILPFLVAPLYAFTAIAFHRDTVLIRAIDNLALEDNSSEALTTRHLNEEMTVKEVLDQIDESCRGCTYPTKWGTSGAFMATSPKHERISGITVSPQLAYDLNREENADFSSEKAYKIKIYYR